MFALIAPAAYAKFGEFKVGPVHVDPTNVQAPVSVDPVKVGPATVTPPSPVLAPGAPPPHPDVRLDEKVPGASIFNKANEILRLPQTTYRRGADWVAAGIDHLGNEIGMLWAKEKEKAEKVIQGWLDWLKEQAWKYGPLAAAGIAGLIALRVIARRMVLSYQRRRHNRWAW